MRAVNLMPADARRGRGDLSTLRGPGAVVLGVLAMGLLLVTLYVLASNSVTQRKAQLAGLQQQLAQTQALSAKLSGYTQFAQLAQTRTQTVRQIAASRFDWKQALSDLSRVVPANTSLDSVTATVSPTSASAGSSAASGGLRGDITAPAFELQGCTSTQDDVARLMSRLRLIRGVTRVTLADAVKSTTSVTGTAVQGTAGSSTGTPGACAANAPTFDLVVFFTAPPVLAAPTTAPTGAATTTSSTTTTPPLTGAAQ
ncbi:MAG: hypothetical protein ACJ764_07965 [Solirubrobacteraceae bacterium]